MAIRTLWELIVIQLLEYPIPLLSSPLLVLVTKIRIPACAMEMCNLLWKCTMCNGNVQCATEMYNVRWKCAMCNGNVQCAMEMCNVQCRQGRGSPVVCFGTNPIFTLMNVVLQAPGTIWRFLPLLDPKVEVPYSS